MLARRARYAPHTLHGRHARSSLPSWWIALLVAVVATPRATHGAGPALLLDSAEAQPRWQGPAAKPQGSKPQSQKPPSQKPQGQKPQGQKPPRQDPQDPQDPRDPPGAQPAAPQPSPQPPETGLVPVPAPVPPAASPTNPEAAASAPRDGRADWHAKLEVEYFEAADYDGGGWISFHESELALGLDRETFHAYDADGDGRVDSSEFGARYREAIERTGVFRPPTAALNSSLPPKRTTEQLLAAYDRDATQLLEPGEAEQLAREYQFGVLDQAELMRRLDRDSSGALGLGELPAVVDWIATVMYPGLQVDPREPVHSLDELFGKREPRPSTFGVLAQPPLVAGPLPMFARLDLDGDGGLESADFEGLQLQTQMGVRAATILAAIDRDGDGRLSRAEFHSAFEKAAP